MLIQELKLLESNCRSNSCIEHAEAIMEEKMAPEKLSKGISTISLTGAEKKVWRRIMLCLWCMDTELKRIPYRSIKERKGKHNPYIQLHIDMRHHSK